MLAPPRIAASVYSYPSPPDVSLLDHLLPEQPPESSEASICAPSTGGIFTDISKGMSSPKNHINNILNHMHRSSLLENLK